MAKKLSKPEQLEQINQKADAARLEAHMTAAPIMLEMELQEFIEDWERRHPEYQVTHYEYMGLSQDSIVKLVETGEKPLYMQMIENSKEDTE